MSEDLFQGETDQGNHTPGIGSVIDLLAHSRLTTWSNRTLFEALGFGRKENPHSDMIAFLLAPDSPLKDGWFLESLCNHVEIESQRISGQLHKVSRERLDASGRPDIVIRWTNPRFVLIVENKIHFSEGEGQCAKYLDDLSIRTEADGKLIFLTLHGNWPKSVKHGDPRVAAMSYRELYSLLQQGIKKHHNSTADTAHRATVFVSEYLGTLSNMLGIGRSFPMVKNASELTAAWLAHEEHIEGTHKAAISESYGLFLFTVEQIRQRMNEQLAPMVESPSTDATFLFRKASWVVSDIEFGIAISGGIMDTKMEKLLTDYYNFAGIRIQPISASDARSHKHKDVARRLKTWIGKNRIPDGDHWDTGPWWVFQKGIKFNASEGDVQKSIDSWRDEVLAKMESLSKDFTPIIDAFVEHEKSLNDQTAK